MAIPLYYDVDAYPVYVGTIVQYYEGHELGDKTYYVHGFSDIDGTLEMSEITDTSGNYMEWHPNYAIPLKLEELCQLVAGI